MVYCSSCGEKVRVSKKKTVDYHVCGSSKVVYKKKRKLYALSAEKKDDGSYEVSAIDGGVLVHRRYYGYTKAQSKKRFLRDVA